MGPVMDDLTRDRLAMAVDDCLSTGADADGIVARLLEEIRRGIGGNAPPGEVFESLPVDPTNLVRLPAAEMAGMLALQYAPLAERSATILAGLKRWQTAHDGGRTPIATEADNIDTADRIRQADDHCKEVEEARRKVTDPLREAAGAIKGWFDSLREPVEAIRGVPSKVGNRTVPPALGTMQQMQSAYMSEIARKAEQARQELLRQQQDAERIAREKAEQAQAEEDARIKHLVAADVPEDEATHNVMATTDALIAEAEMSRSALGDAAKAAAAPLQSIAKTRGAVSSAHLQATVDFEETDPALFRLAAGAAKLMQPDFRQEIAVRASIGRPAVDAILDALLHILMPHRIPVPPDWLELKRGDINRAIGPKGLWRAGVPGLTIEQSLQARRRSA